LIALANTDPFVAAGNEALQNNKPDEALAQYQKAEATLPNNPDLAFNKGGALYAQQKYKEAATEFLSATSSKDNKKRAEAYQHYGDALFRQKDVNGAIQAYEQALTLNPEDTVARHNLEVALSQQKEQPQSQPNQDQNQDQSQSQPQSQPQSQNSESQPSSQQNQQQQQDQQNKDNKEKQDQQNQQQQSGQDKENQEKKDEQQSAQEKKDQEEKEKQKQQEQQAQQAQQSKQNNEQPPPNEPQDKLLDALRAKEKSFLHAKQKGKGAAQPNVSKDW
jgi:Ca-activated chloride channel family protein